MKNKKLIVIILIIIGVIIASILLRIFMFKYLSKKIVEEQKEVQKKIENEIKKSESYSIQMNDIINVGETAPDFTLEDLDGNKVSLKDFKGEKIVYLNFWATWCPPCRMEMPDLNRLYEEYKDEDVIVLAVNLGESEKIVREFIEENQYTFPVLLDKSQKVGINYNTFAIPTSVIIDKEGVVRVYVPGLLTYEEMKEALDSAR